MSQKANESETEHSSKASDEKEVPVKRKRKSSKDDSTEVSAANRSRKRSALDLADLSTDSTPSPTCVDGLFTFTVGEDIAKIVSFPDGFVDDDWFLQNASGSASPFTSVDEYEDSSLSGEDDGTVNSGSDRNAHPYPLSYYGGVFGHSFDEDVLDSGILEIFGH
jgi:hypothetical protein